MIHNANMQFDDAEWELVSKAKGSRTWKKFLLESAEAEIKRQQKAKPSQ